MPKNTDNIRYRVVTNDMKSLGPRRNPNILTYPVGEWFYLSNSEVVPGNGDYGGIWVCKKFSGVKTLVKYMKEKYDISTRIFKAEFDKNLYSNSYRIKTNGVKLLEEIVL
jgi:hypothetical protein